jgi:glutamyl-tRNA synthetase
MAKISVDYSKPARTRIAPSPTGEMQIGNLRTLLYDYALARKTNGKFIFRLEDTDNKRFVEGSSDRMLDLLCDYGLSWDEGPRVGGSYGPYVQTERLKIGKYDQVYKDLLEKGHVYRCFCTEDRLSQLREDMLKRGKVPMYDKYCRFLSENEIKENLSKNIPFTIRIKIPQNEKIEFHDILRGKIVWDSADVDDYILVKSNGIPTYHGAVVIDDYEMKITHVLRGMDWIPTTPVYVILARYLGYDLPVILHTSDLMNSDPTIKGKLSKRRSGEKVFARYQLDAGYPKEAVLNYLMFLGWSHPDEKVNILSLDDFCKVFTIERLQVQGPRIDWEKLEWYGGQYIRKMSQDELFDNFKKWLGSISNAEIKQKCLVWKQRLETDEQKLRDILQLLQERMRKYSDIFEQGEFFYTRPIISDDILEKTKHSKEDIIKIISDLKNVLGNSITDNIWLQENWEKAIRNLAENYDWKAGDMFMLLRLLIVGSPFSPNLLDSMNVLGKEESLKRIEESIS